MKHQAKIAGQFRHILGIVGAAIVAGGYADEGVVTEIIGGLMALFVLLVFLRRIRPTIIVALAIPGSIVAAFVFMFASGMTLNLITMMSMIVAIGMVVDNSIVVIENIYRHRDMGKGVRESARDGASEVALAIIAAAEFAFRVAV